MRNYFLETCFCELGLEICKFHGSYFRNINKKFNFTERCFCDVWPKDLFGHHFKRYLFLTMFLPRFNFLEKTFLRSPKVAKTCSCETFLRYR